ncbi:hypothetical protein BGZ73_007949, partial [Actinomortierella ambigua]
STDLASAEPIFSYIDNALEISIFGEYDRIRHDFPQDLCPGLEISDHVYRALQVDNEPLAKAGVSIFYNSTYQTDLLFVPEEKLPVVYKAFQTYGIHISLPDHDFEQLQDQTFDSLAIHAQDDQPSLTPPDTPVTAEHHFSKDGEDANPSLSSAFSNSYSQESEERRPQEDEPQHSARSSPLSMTPWALSESLQQEMACRSVAESLRVERLSMIEHEQEQELRSFETLTVQDDDDAPTDTVLPSPDASLSSFEESRFGPTFSSSASSNAPQPLSSPFGSYQQQQQQHGLAHQHASSLKPLETAWDATTDQSYANETTATNTTTASSSLPSSDRVGRLSSSSSCSASSGSSSSTTTTTTTATMMTAPGAASPTTTTAFELRHQAIRTLPENLLRCVGLNTELEMGPPRWMLKVIKILFYEDRVKVPRGRGRACSRRAVYDDNYDDDDDDDDDEEESEEGSSPAWRATTPRFFSFTATADSVSMITDVEILETEFEEHELFMSLDQCPLRLIRLDLHRFDLDKVGIVQSVARPLTEAGIELLYLSTFSTANILVLEHRLDDAERILSGTPTPSGYIG